MVVSITPGATTCLRISPRHGDQSAYPTADNTEEDKDDDDDCGHGGFSLHLGALMSKFSKLRSGARP